MKNVFIALIVALVSGCVSNARIETLEKRLADSEEQNKRLRQANADGYQPPGAPSLPSKDPGGPAVAGNPMMGMGAQGSTGVMWARQKHGVYMGAVGQMPRQATQGRKIKVTNQVCDDGARGFVCEDRDDNGAPDFNTWLSFEIDDQPAVCDSGFFHPEMQVSLLLPLQSCYVEFGASRKAKLTIRFYRNNGNPYTYADLDSTPYKTITKIVTLPNGLFSLTVEELTSSAF